MMLPIIQYEYLKQIYEHMQDGIIIMKESREIIMLNPAAKKLTGWQIGEDVPYCSFCMTRNNRVEKPSCYLIANNEVPAFLSQMPTYHGKEIDVEMSTAVIYPNSETGETEYLLVLRDHAVRQQAHEAALNKKRIGELIEAKESEHKRLAQELHDGVGQSLFSMSVALDAIESYVHENEKLTNYIGEVRQELQKVMGDVNAYAHQLRPHSLDQLGLKATLEILIEKIQKNVPELFIELTTQGLDRCDPAVEINLYRIAQEALHNITKYAKASVVKIHILKNNKQIFMKIEDDGIGFDRKQLRSEGLGLKHIEERVNQLNGTCVIQSAMNEGTSIDIVIPRWRPNT
ncbi:histidine kinase [Lysinibacillus sp. KU-BSD001]|uniref:PAS domain-containing sensor histidine kinase n=1 Tax=Lysinibacillus sp. KU-BSD001 TaxID=3141328 RepID=UPI0036E1F53E